MSRDLAGRRGDFANSHAERQREIGVPQAQRSAMNNVIPSFEETREDSPAYWCPRHSQARGRNCGIGGVLAVPNRKYS